MTKKHNRSRSRQGSRRRWFWPTLLFLATFLPAFWIYHALFSPLDIPAGYRLQINRGDNLYQLLDRLEAEGILRSAALSKAWLRLHGRNVGIQPGEFALESPLSAVQLLERVTRPEQVRNRLTVIEGTTFRDLLAQLAARGDIKHTLAGKSPAEVLQAIGVTEAHPEGLFAPDTYDIGAADSDADILRRLYRHQQQILAEEWEQRAPGLPYASPYEALIMASIVEKETGVAHERAQIAGVFVRRLQRQMRLQTDPTVIYGMGENYQGKIGRKHLREATPYNTYRIDGLPPTPIALPGRAAIHAALHPAPGTALFFVARGDGSHVFSATLPEHNAAVKKYQLQRASGYRSFPAP